MGEHITARGIVVPDSAISVHFARSGGPGGQHVNTSSSKVHLSIDIDACQMPEHQRGRVQRALGSSLVVVCEDSRSQWRNRQMALSRALAAIDEAAAPVARRVATRPGRSATRRRLEEKSRRSEIKQQRRRPLED